ncbi:MAG: aldehyde dehydrogenase family protein [Gammaproteobacteria bacterium]
MNDATKRRRRSGGNRTRRDADRLPVAKTYKIYIGGKFPRTESGRYYPLQPDGETVIANVCRSSRKDFREAVVAARGAFGAWSAASAYLRGQILYRIAEMLEGRRDQFIAELARQGETRRRAEREADAAVDRLIHYAGWSDKYQQIFSAVNPVASSHFNFSLLEPTGVVAIIAPEDSGLLGLISNLGPAIVGGNTCVVLASETRPLTAVSFAEVLHSSDVPGGVVNILTGFRKELAAQFASHMDVNAVVFCEAEADLAGEIQIAAADNLKRVVDRSETDWAHPSAQGPYLIRDTQEVKTTWHPVGG